MRWEDGALAPVTGIPEPGQPQLQPFLRRPRGRLWAGFGSDGLAMHDHGTYRAFGVEDGLTRGDVRDPRGSHRRRWVATHNGVSRYRNGRFTALTLANGPFDEVSGMLVEDNEGYLWVGIDNGASVLRFDPAQVDRVEADPGYQIEYPDVRHHGRHEGRDPAAHPPGRREGRGWAPVVRERPGRGDLRSGQLAAEPAPQPAARGARVRRGRVVSGDADLELPNGTSILGIEYTTASRRPRRSCASGIASKASTPTGCPANPTAWPSTRTCRRAATASAWPPRTTASGPSPQRGSSPSICRCTRQTQFLVPAALALTLVLGAARWLRVRALRAQYAMVFEERTRVSREIHDTLLQSLAAIGMELETIAATLGPPAAPAQDSLRRLRRQVSHTVRDARDTVWGLRHGRIERSGLVEALKEVAGMITATRHVQVEVAVEGRPRRIVERGRTATAAYRARGDVERARATGGPRTSRWS